MKVLLDNCVDHRFARFLSEHEILHARDLGWAELSNGKLLKAAEEEGFDVLVTVDRGLRHQQNMAGRKITLVTLLPKLIDIEHLEPLAPRLLEQLLQLSLPGQSLIVALS